MFLDKLARICPAAVRNIPPSGLLSLWVWSNRFRSEPSSSPSGIKTPLVRHSFIFVALRGKRQSEISAESFDLTFVRGAGIVGDKQLSFPEDYILAMEAGPLDAPLMLALEKLATEQREYLADILADRMARRNPS